MFKVDNESLSVRALSAAEYKQFAMLHSNNNNNSSNNKNTNHSSDEEDSESESEEVDTGTVVIREQTTGTFVIKEDTVNSEDNDEEENDSGTFIYKG
jgi:hypothetical protein